MSQCQAKTRAWTGRFLISAGHRCVNPAKYGVSSNKRNKVPPEDEVCGVHVRPYLMDNGDSVWKPWNVWRLA